MTRALLFALLATSAAPVWAQEASDDASAEEQRRREEIVVTATRTIDGGQVARNARLGVLGTGDIYETPFSVKSFTSELILNQAPRTLDELLVNDPSIRSSLAGSSFLDQSAIRGFLVLGSNSLFDGLANFAPHRSRVPILHFERVDVLKGPSTAFVGGASANSAGGTINYVPKRAGDTPVLAINGGVRSADSFNLHVDAGRRFGPEGMFGVRVNVSGDNGDLYDSAFSRSGNITAAFDLRLDRFRAVLDAGYTEFRNFGIGRNLTLAANAALPAVPDPETQAQPDWVGAYGRNYFALLAAEYDLSDKWTINLRGGFNHSISREPFIGTGPVNSDGTFAVTSRSAQIFTNQRTTLEATLRGNFELAGMRHDLVVSGSQFYGGTSNFTAVPSFAVTGVTRSIYATIPVADPFPNGLPPESFVESVQPTFRGASIADTIHLLDDRVIVTLVARQQQIKQGAYNQSKFAPTAAILAKVTDRLSIYANYAQGLTQGSTAPTGAANANEQLPPFVAEQYEGGVKYDGGSFGVTAAYFDISQASAFLDPATNIFAANGRQRNTGFELETFGQPVPGLRLLGGVAYIEGKQEETAGGTFDGQTAVGVSKWNVSASAELDVPGVPGLTATGRYIYTDKAFLNLANTQVVPSWERVDVGIRYASELLGKRTTLRLNVTNLLDKAYFQASAARNLLLVAAPRVVSLSASINF